VELEHNINHQAPIKRLVYSICDRILSQPPTKLRFKLVEFILRILLKYRIPRWGKLHFRFNPNDNETIHFFALIGIIYAHILNINGERLRSCAPKIKLPLQHIFALSISQTETATKIFSISSKDISYEEAINEFNRLFGSNPIYLYNLLATIIGLVYAENDPEDQQLNMITQASTLLGFQPETLNHLLAEQNLLNILQRRVLDYQKKLSLSDNSALTVREKILRNKDPSTIAAQILGCDKDADQETIRKNYRKLAYDNHPDRISSAGKSNKEIERAREKFKEILWAYDLLKRGKK
jgi:DnaJ-domain-containing protein 1